MGRKRHRWDTAPHLATHSVPHNLRNFRDLACGIAGASSPRPMDP
jgi:hypothetical protein